MKIKFPKNQTQVLNYNDTYLITRDKVGTYILYAIDATGVCTKLKTSISPLFPEVYPELQGGDK